MWSAGKIVYEIFWNFYNFLIFDIFSEFWKFPDPDFLIFSGNFRKFMKNHEKSLRIIKNHEKSWKITKNQIFWKSPKNFRNVFSSETHFCDLECLKTRSSGRYIGFFSFGLSFSGKWTRGKNRKRGALFKQL